jgi:hypothetical protein
MGLIRAVVDTVWAFRLCSFVRIGDGQLLPDESDVVGLQYISIDVGTVVAGVRLLCAVWRC